MIFIDKNVDNRSTHWWDRFILAQWNFDVNPSFTDKGQKLCWREESIALLG